MKQFYLGDVAHGGTHKLLGFSLWDIMNKALSRVEASIVVEVVKEALSLD
jgi:hypothetical protein